MKTSDLNLQRLTFPRIAGHLSAAMGLFVLVGWALNIPWVKSVLPGAVEMKANTAVGLLLAGIALGLLDDPASPGRRRMGQALAVMVALIGLATAAEYAFGWRLGIDELLFRDTTDAYNPFRGRMSPYSAVVFASLGLGLVALPLRALRWLVWPAANLAILIGGVSFIGYLWQASELVTDRILPPVAVNTAAIFILLGGGMIVASRPRTERNWGRMASYSSVETKTLAGFLAIFLLLLLMGGQTYRAAVAAAESARWATHIQQVRANLSQMHASVLNTESQHRNYLLSGKPDYLEAYKHHAGEAVQQAKTLAGLIADDPAQSQRLNELQKLINERLAVLDRTRAAFEQSGLTAAYALIANGEGQQLMSSILDAVERMDAAEADRLKARLTDAADQQFKTLLSLLVTLAVATAGFMMLYSGIRRELAARAGVEESLRRSEEKLAVTLHSIGDAVLATDPQGRITRMNGVAEKLTGWTQAEALGRPVAEVFHIINERTREPAVIPVNKVLATGKIHGLANHTIIIARDGTERPIADSAAPIRDKAGRMLGVVLVFRDVTEEKKAEAEVRRLNAGLEELVAQRTAEVREAFATLDATVDGAFTFEPESLRFIHVNKGAVRQLGYTHAELFTLTPPAIDTRHTEAAFRKMIAPLIHGEKSVLAYESVHRRKNGEEFAVEINLQYVRPEGAPPRFIAIVRDVTERKKAELQARRSQRIESIGTLAAGIAHDLNNALAPILMSSGILKSKYPRESQMLDMIESSTHRAADMVHQLLTFAKGAEGERVPLPPARLVKEMQKIMEASFPKNIRVAIQCAPELPRVLGDATQLHQVLLNLCVNARDSMPNGGTLTLEAESRTLDATYASSIPDAKHGNYLLLRVHDTGTGIPPEIIDRIFDPFFTTKGPDKGTGLGLSTVLGIVKGHGGFLHVYSQPGQGSTFTIYLPVENARGDTEFTAKSALTFRGNGELVLFVDDEPGVRQTAQAVLRRLNFKPLTAPDGADGLMQAAQYSGDLRAVITDLHMPHMDGLAFVRTLRRMLPDIPVVVASGRMEDAIAEEFKTLGVPLRLDKPFTEAQLAEVLKNALTPK